MDKVKGREGALEEEAAKERELERMEVVYSKAWKGKEYGCDGVWAFSAVEGRHAWSCCGSFVQDGPGCQPRKKPGTGWNYASIN
eukprot:680400-Rhodomonas_salina.1